MISLLDEIEKLECNARSRRSEYAEAEHSLFYDILDIHRHAKNVGGIPPFYARL